MALLELNGVTLSFGGVKVLQEVTFAVEAGSVVGVIGPNGAGKTSVMNVITGLHACRSGSLRFDGVEIGRAAAHDIAAMGIRRTFQTSLLCSGLTVLENVMLGMEPNLGYGLSASLIRSPKVMSRERKLRDRAMEVLDWMGMAEFRHRDGKDLSFGQQRLVELARALASEPRILLLDEPAVGLSPPRVDELAENIRKIRATFNTTILLIEHVIKLVLNTCDSVVVMNAGAVIAQGRPDDVTNDPAVIESYLGRGYYAAS
jgi:branched-chain amino acid transport system ATP-binding protein